MVIILAVFYKIAKTVFAINLCGLSCFSLWFELTMCLCSLNQALSNWKKHTLCLVRVIATRMLEILFSLIMQQIKVDAFTDLKCRKLRGIVT